MNVSPIGSGNITSPNFHTGNPTSYPATYTCSLTYALTAVPNDTTEYQFDRWGGDYTGSSNPLTVSVSDGVKSVTAYFKLVTEDISPPTSLSAKAKASTQIVIGWKDNSDSETGFKIEMKEGACGSANSWTQIAAKPANATTHSISGLAPNTTYAFRVRAYNESANSDYSNCASAKTALSGTPPAPSNLRATSTSSTTVNLSWNDNSTNETGFKIYRRAGSGTWALRATTLANVKAFNDTTASNNPSTTTYQYYVMAYNASGNSPASNTATVPYQPTNLTAAQGATTGTVNLTWTHTSSNEAGFEIYRKSGNCSSISTWAKIATLGANETSWTNTGCTSGSTYSYRIRSYIKTGSILSAYGYSMWSPCKSEVLP